MSTNRPVIAVDAMGGDHGPSVVVPGALAHLEADSPFAVALYGDQALIQAEIQDLNSSDLPVSVVHCTQGIEMGESPASAIRNKKDSPIVRAMADHKAGKVQAVVSAGSTGAQVAASLIVLGRLPGIDRPAIGTIRPTAGSEMLMLDAGANIQCTPEHLLSFARMGEVFAREILEVERPRIGQLNIGGEASKGMDLNVAAYELLTNSGMEFVGNVEGNMILLGPCDVLVTDGFTGNNTLKMIEGFARFMGALSQRPDLTEKQKSAFGPVLGFLMEHYSYEVYGGAMLLGVDGVSIIAHGRSSARAISGAVQVAWDQVRHELPARLAEVSD